MGLESPLAPSPTPPPQASCSPSLPASPATSTGGGKRGRDPEEELYLDNLHSHKRYLSEMMASSLNGLSVDDTLDENLMVSPSRSSGICYPREEFLVPCSPMSEDSDDSRFSEIPTASPMVQSDVSRPGSPVSPHRYQKSLNGLSSANPYLLSGCCLPTVTCSHPRHRGSDTEGRFPSSPNDMCHAADLRRTALLRSVQMRTQPSCSPSYDQPYISGQENMQCGEDAEDQSCCIKGLDDENEYHCLEQTVENYVEDCSLVKDLPEIKCSESENDDTKFPSSECETSRDASPL